MPGGGGSLAGHILHQTISLSLYDPPLTASPRAFHITTLDRHPALGPNVCLAGKPRLVAKLHRPWPGGAASPARANSSLVPKGVETTATTLATPAGDDVDASFGPGTVLRTVWTRHGQVLRTCPPLVYTRRPRAHSLTASVTTIRETDDGTGSGQLPESSVIPGNPSTKQSGPIVWASHERKRETTTGRGRSTGTPPSPAPCSTGCCTMPTSSRSAVTATGSERHD